jgi:tRNA(fMet)-specific endonuclease VapC
MPTPGRVALDTSGAVAILRGVPTARSTVAGLSFLGLPVIALGELCYGAERALRSTEERAAVSRLVERCTILPVSSDVAEQYGRVKAALARQGTPIPENDIWIAATAIHYDLTLLTTDQDHFSKVQGLSPKYL